VEQSERTHREGHAVQARPVKTFRELGDIKKGTAELWKKSNLRVKRRDPWHRANALPKAVAVLAQDGEDAERKSQPCLDLVRKPVAQPSVEASLKASLKTQWFWKTEC
jgi:hypothetical protein